MRFFGNLFKSVGDWSTAGPPEDEHPSVTFRAMTKSMSAGWFVEGWLQTSERLDAHPDRTGPTIVPRTAVVHTTDMLPDSFAALRRAWATSRGSGAAAHFILGRSSEQGLTQMIPITRNGNHAGGPTVNGKPIHGWWKTAAGKLVHPNTVAVGIEVHGAGRLRWKPGMVRAETAQFVEDGKVKAEFSVRAGEVHVDELGRPWHVITEYQLETLEELLRSLRPALQVVGTMEPVSDAPYLKDHSNWDTGYAIPVANSLVGHVTLDPINKTDPGPQLMACINDIAKKEGWQ